MEAFLVSTGIVALAEMGDKTQLLALILAVRFRKPWPIVLGILVATLAQGEAIQALLESFVPGVTPGGQWRMTEFVHSKRPNARQVIDAFVAGEVPILIGTSLIGEGTDLPSADALIYAPGGKAEVGHSQAIYRVCTALPGKKRALVVDFSDQHNETLNHHTIERLNTYYGMKTFTTTVLADPAQLPGWVDAAGA